jgi:GntR family transcriptional repressor for pyruvate dehydrogenase complex
MEQSRPVSTRATGGITSILMKQIRELIQSGELPPGSKLLPERELAQRLQVSRSSLRQAVKALESVGVLSSRVGVGTFVRGDVEANVLLTDSMEFAVRTNRISRTKLLEARQLLDVEIVALTAERASPESIALIGAELERMKAASGDPHLIADADYRFHLAIIHACGNEVFEMIYSPISKLVWEDFSERVHLFDPAQIIHLHELIYQAIQRRDAEGARLATKHHLEVGYKLHLTAESSTAHYPTRQVKEN